MELDWNFEQNISEEHPLVNIVTMKVPRWK